MSAVSKHPPKFKFTLEGLEPVSLKAFPYTQAQRDWLLALRSGKYKQGGGFLKSMNNEFCCLGVACELAGLRSEQSNTGAYDFGDEHSPISYRSYMPPVFANAFGLNGTLGEFSKKVRFPGLDYPFESLAAMNDNRLLPDGRGDARPFSFNEIADYIEHDPWNVFKEAECNTTLPISS